MHSSVCFFGVKSKGCRIYTRWTRHQIAFTRWIWRQIVFERLKDYDFTKINFKNEVVEMALVNLESACAAVHTRYFMDACDCVRSVMPLPRMVMSIMLVALKSWMLVKRRLSNLITLNRRYFPISEGKENPIL